MLGNSKTNQQLIQFKISSGVFDNLDNIDAKVTPTKYLELHESRWIGSTPLHLLSSIRFKDTLNATLSKNADYTIKNQNGSTVLHLMLRNYDTNEFCYSKLRNVLRVPSINNILSIHVNMRNPTNPYDSNGMSHFHIACMANHVEAVEFFLDNNVSIDHAINLNSPYFAGFTGLHLAIRCCCFKVTKLLLEHGASMDLKNNEEKTAVHIVMENHLAFASDVLFRYFDHTDLPKKHTNEEITKLLLEILNNNHTKIVDSSALTSLYIAHLIMNNVVPEKLLTKEVLNRSIDMESSVWPGYTAMHFAALTDCKTIKFFLKNGADLLVKDANGIRPFDLLIDRYSIEEISNIISLDSVCRKITCSRNRINLSDLLSAVKGVDQFESFLKSYSQATRCSVPWDSPVWPGFTLMHFVVLFSKLGRENNYTENVVRDKYLQMIKKLHYKNTQAIIAQDRHGRTALHLAFQLGKMTNNIGDLLLELLIDNPFNLVDKDGLSLLHIACTKDNQILVEKLLSRGKNVNIAYKGKSIGQLIETGWTPLHMAVANNSTNVVKVLLKYGADVHSKDLNGITPIHLLVFSKSKCAESLLSVPNLRESIVEGAGLSHLHAACSEGMEDAVKKLLDNGSDINLKITNNSKIADKSFNLAKLVKYMAGYTPLQMIGFYNLSSCFSSISEKLRCLNTLDLLIQRGADIFVEDSKGMSFLARNLEYFTKYLKKDENLRRQAEIKIGLTEIHLACFKRDLIWLYVLLLDDTNTDINKKLGMNFPGHAGFTPLHVVIADSYRKYQDQLVRSQINHGADVNQGTQIFDDRNNYEIDKNQFIKLLLDKGADVTLSNANQQTPVHMAYENYREYHEHFQRVIVMLKAQKNFRINPCSVEGISHFHIACSTCQTGIVKKFLERGNFDVNQPTDFFAVKLICLAGCTPLHLAASCNKKFIDTESQLETIDLLLKHGADLNFQNSRGNTPLHVVKRSDIFERIARGNADTNIRNTEGDTPLGYLIIDTCYQGCTKEHCNQVSIDQIKHWLRSGCNYNAFNIFDKKGYIGLSIIKIPFEELRSLFKTIVINMLSAIQIDDKGRTVIHNAVSISYSVDISIIEYATLLEILAKAGYDIDSQDNLGRTALHVAAEFGNYKAVSALLMLGADANILDKQGRTALACQINRHRVEEYNHVLDILLIHVKKLQICQLAVCQSDESYVAQEYDNIIVEEEFNTELGLLKIAPRFLTLHRLISETNAVVHYPTMSEVTRDIVDEFFHQDNVCQLREQFSEVVEILSLQYRKAVNRSKLIESAVASLNFHANFQVPELCSDIILKFLSNADLKNLIASTYDCQKHRQIIIQEGHLSKNKNQRLQ